MPYSSHYVFNRYALDPAFAGGAYDKAAVYLNYRRDWGGNIEGSPPKHSGQMVLEKFIRICTSEAKF